MSNLRRDARCLIRQREPIHCYWQLFFPTRFNELHKVARHASRRSFRFLSKPVAPIASSVIILFLCLLCLFLAIILEASVATHVAPTAESRHLGSGKRRLPIFH